MRVMSVTVTPTLTLNAYTAVDVVGGLMTFDFGPVSNGGVIRQILITDAAAQSEQYSLYIFDDEPTTIANDAAFAPAIADLGKLVDVVTVATADWTEINSLDWAIIGSFEDGEMRIPFSSVSGNLYMYAVATDTPDYAAADDLTFTLVVEEL